MNDNLPFFHDRAAEIVAAYGADPAAWPDAERAAALTVVAGDATLVAAQAQAAALDTLLREWARAPVAAGDPAALAATAMATRRSPLVAVRGWAAGVGLAAAAAVAVAVLPMKPAAVPVVPTESAAVALTAADATAFSTVFTPTPDEENFL